MDPFEIQIPVEIVPGLLLGGLRKMQAILDWKPDVLVPLERVPGYIWKEGFRGEIVYYPICDYGTLPDDVLERLVDEVVARLHAGKRTAIFCVGGHGRTGYVSACVLYRLGIGNPIVFLREKYSVFAVESSEQELAVERFIEAEKQKRRPGVGQWQSRRERGSGNVHTESEGPPWRTGDRGHRTLC